MRAVLLDRCGPPETLRIGEAPRPDPGPGEVRIAVRAAGLNPADYKIMERGSPGWRLPVVVGLDPAGVVDAVGPGVDGFRLGDRVASKCSFSRMGAFAEHVVCPAHVVWPLPPELSFEDAAALPTAGLTAYQTLHRRLRVRAGETVAIIGASGGVGTFAVQLARAASLRVIAVASVPNHAMLLTLGADQAIDYREKGWIERILALTGGRGCDAVIDLAGPESASEGLGLLAHGGALACVAGTPLPERITPFPRGIAVHDVALGVAFLRNDMAAEADLARMGVELSRLAAAGRVRAQVGEIVGLADIPAALTRLAGRRVAGKIVARIGA